MESCIHDSKSLITEVKREPVECALQSCHVPVEIDYKNIESAVSIKKEAYAFAPLAEIKIDTIDVKQNISNTGIASDIKIELNLTDDINLLNSSYSNDESCKEGDYVNESGFQIAKIFDEHKICKKPSVIRPIDIKNPTNKTRGILKHIGVHDGRYKCTICSRHFERRPFILKHMQLHRKHKEKSEISKSIFQFMHNFEINYKCQVCNKCFKTKRSLSNHMTYKCEICMKCLISKAKLTSHMTVHTGERSYKCEICTKSFKTKQNLSCHMATHTTGKKHGCEICTKRFKTKQSLANHVKLHTSERNHNCDICTKCFKTKQKLSSHMIIHTGERNYKCEICTKCFTSKGNLSRHIKMHTGERNYQCEICMKCLTSKDKLSNHMTIHTGEKNYRCELCTECFTSKQNLSRHVVIHTSERNYKCDVCTKSFVTKAKLSRHVTIHTGERIFKCQICFKCVTSKQSLSIHMKIHTGEKNYKCEICTKCFVTKSDLSRHMITHAGNRNVFLEYKTTHIEVQPVRKFPCNAQGIDKIEKALIREEPAMLIKKEKFAIDNDTMKREQSMATKESHIDAPIKEEKPSTEIFDLWQKFSSEITVKEERGTS